MTWTTESITTVAASTLQACFTQPDGPRLVGLCGAAGAGKSTVASMLEHVFDVHCIALADPILNMLYSLYSDAGVPAAWITERSLKEQPCSLGYSYRHLAQTLGTEWGRNGLDAGIWMRVAQARIAQAASHEKHVVVSDIRFPDEAEWLQRMGGTLVRVVRPSLATEVRPHSSEAHAATLPAAFELRNHGNLRDLGAEVRALARQLLPALHAPITQPGLTA